MIFIGIVIENYEKINLEDMLNKFLKNNKNKYNIILINKDSVENIKNIKFETILIVDDLFTESKYIDIIIKIISNAKYVIINSDIKENLKILENLKLSLITYGYNSKATITLSSVEDKKILIYLQRTIINNNYKAIEPQEISIKIDKEIKLNEQEIYGLIGSYAIILIYSKDFVQI